MLTENVGNYTGIWCRTPAKHLSTAHARDTYIDWSLEFLLPSSDHPGEGWKTGV